MTRIGFVAKVSAKLGAVGVKTAAIENMIVANVLDIECIGSLLRLKAIRKSYSP
jgi:hypothetical protein